MRIILTCYPPAEEQYRFFSCEDSLVAYFRSIDTSRGQVREVAVYGALWLNASTIIRELIRFDHLEWIALSRMSSLAMDSVLCGLEHSELILGVTLRQPDSGPPPASMFRFRNVESAWLEFSDPGIICRALREWERLEELTYIGSARDIECACERQRRLLYGATSDTAGLDSDILFVTTGIYHSFTSVYSLMPASSRRKYGVIPVIGTREYTVSQNGVSRAALSAGVMDRFLAVLVARAEAREDLFDGNDNAVTTRFLQKVAHSEGVTDVRYEVDSVVLFGEFVYRGPLLAVMQRLLEEGCF